MAIKAISVKCPECGADLDYKEGREFIFCSYCGAKVLLRDENEQVTRHIDEAGVKQAETDRIVKLKKLEFYEKRLAEMKQEKAQKLKLSLIMAAVGGVLCIIGFFCGSASGDSDSPFYMLSILGFLPLISSAFNLMNYFEKDEEEISMGEEAKVPASISGSQSKSYTAIAAILKQAGFTNITCIPLNDLTVGLIKRPGMVESITINGKEVTSGGKKFAKDAPVIISYHSLSR